MKKKITLTVVIVLTLALFVGIFSGCAVPINSLEEVKELYSTAIANSKKAEIYYWKETILNTGAANKTSFKRFNLWAELKNYEPALNEDGSYANLVANYYEEYDSKEILNMTVGKSKGASKKDEVKNYQFNTTHEGTKTIRTKKPMSIDEYLLTDEYKAVSLSTMIAELDHLTVDDMDFDAKGGAKGRKLNVVSLTFKIRPEYLTRYKEETGKDSLFAGSSKVFIEIAYDRITNITTYVEQGIENSNGMTVEVEKYKLQITYYGPKIDVPAYNATNKDGSTVWQDA